jgi:hypothetical protein
VRVGFLTTISWDRYGPFWQQMLASVGVDVVLPEADAVVEAGAELDRADGLLAWLARATLRSLDQVDLVVVPRLLPEGVAGPGSAQDPWVADLAGVLAHAEPAAPGLVTVPAETGHEVEHDVIPLLTRLQPDASKVRRAWAQHRSDALRSWRPASAPPPVAAGRRVALAGAPWWCQPRLVPALARPGEVLVGQHQIDPADLRAEGRRWRADLNDVDAEVLGAVRRFARRSDVDAVRLIVDGAGMADGWWARRARALAEDRVEVTTLESVMDGEALVRALVPGGPRATTP